MKATKSFGRSGRAGFTLVELLVVIGLMAMLGTVSIGGYFAASRGMKIRGVTQDTISVIRHARQLCLIENTPVAVLFVNRWTGEEDKGGEMYGTAVTVKMTGRITMVVGNGGKTTGGSSVDGFMLVDEFADWNTSFPIASKSGKEKSGMRLYRMTEIKSKAESGGIQACSSLTKNCVGYVRMSPKQDYDVLLAAGTRTDTWCDMFKKDKSSLRNRKDISLDYDNANDYRWGIVCPNSQNGYLTAGDWKAGDAYGVEAGSFDLPKGFIFGSSAPSQDGKIHKGSPAAIVFLPSQATSAGQSDMNFTTVPIYAVGMGGKGDTPVKIGEVRKTDCEDQN